MRADPEGGPSFCISRSDPSPLGQKRAVAASAWLNLPYSFLSPPCYFSPFEYLPAIRGRLRTTGGIGQPLSLLLKLNKDVTDLRLYDIRGAPGVGADLSHIDTPATVRSTWPLRAGRSLETGC